MAERHLHALRQRGQGLVTALIFDCDGVLADTERFGHLPAFNQTFAEFGLPVRWSEEEYGEKLQIGGGKERMASLLTPEFVARGGPAGGRRRASGRCSPPGTRRKTAIYTEMVGVGSAAGASRGSRGSIGEALDAGWTLAVASTSAEASVRAVLEHVAGAEQAARFARSWPATSCPRKKPAPDIYELALERLGRGAGRGARGRGLAQRPGGRDGRRAAVRGHGQRLHRGRGLPRGGAGRELARRPRRRAEPRARRRCRAEPRDWVTLRDLEACLEG